MSDSEKIMNNEFGESIFGAAGDPFEKGGLAFERKISINKSCFSLAGHIHKDFIEKMADCICEFDEIMRWYNVGKGLDDSLSNRKENLKIEIDKIILFLNECREYIT